MASLRPLVESIAICTALLKLWLKKNMCGIHSPTMALVLSVSFIIS